VEITCLKDIECLVHFAWEVEGGLCKLKKLDGDLDLGVEIEWEFGEFDQSFSDD
jgi:hypothetical protein